MSRWRPTLRGRWHLAAVAALAVVSVGCSDDAAAPVAADDTAADGPAEEAPADAAPSGNPPVDASEIDASSTFTRRSLDARSTVDGAALGGETTLERRAIELFSDLGATDTDVGALVEVPDDVLFDFDDDTLKPAAAEVIADLAELAELTDDVPILIVGHTDGRGSDDHNLDLSQRRADAVAQALADAGVDPGRIEATGVGSSEPVAEEGGADDEEARARNRRVEATFAGVDLDG